MKTRKFILFLTVLSISGLFCYAQEGIANRVTQRFTALSGDETLAYFYADNTTGRYYAISRTKKTARVIYEISDPEIWAMDFYFSENGKHCLYLICDNHWDSAPIYYINGTKGTITYLFDSTKFARISRDGRFIAGIQNNPTDKNYFYLFNTESGKQVKTFPWNKTLYNETWIYQDGISNFKIYNFNSPFRANMEALLDTRTGLITIIRDYTDRSDEEGFDDYDLPRIKSIDNKFLLNSQPGLLRDLKIIPPPKKVDSRYFTVENLRLRSEPNTSSSIIKTMDRDTDVEVMEIGRSDTIDGMASNWVKVKIFPERKDIGWCFGAYLVEFDLVR
jgi:hypothetical protein